MLSDDDFRTLLAHLNRPWSGYRKVRKGVKKRLKRHMAALGCTSIRAYLQRIERDAVEMDACQRRLAVTISRFFRDRQLWVHLGQRILPILAERFPGGLSAWSAGCANGEEPYTLSMVWEAFASGIFPPPALNILATDVLPSCLERARQGIYPESSLREVPEAMRRRWFHKVPGKGLWGIDHPIKARISWRSHQLLDRPPENVFQVILLRNNLLTYYQGAEMEAVFNRIVAALGVGGVLVVGSHEQPPLNHFRMERDADCPWVYTASGRCPKK